MSSISVSNVNSTPRALLDNQRPPAMLDADKILARVTQTPKKNTTEVIELMQKLKNEVTKLKGTDLAELWDGVEKALNRKKSLPIKAKSDETKVHTVMGLFYSALDQIDRESVLTGEITALKELYADTASHATSKFRGKMSRNQQRIFDRIIETIDKRFTAVSERFNERIDNGEIPGPKLS